MNKKIILAISGIVCIVLIYFTLNWVINDDSKKGNKNTFSMNGDEKGKSDIFPLGQNEDQYSESIFGNESTIPYGEFTEKLKTGEINLVWEIWAMRGKCPENLGPEQCDNSILAYIDSHYTSPEKESMKKLFSGYFKYENEIRQMESNPNMSFEERYEILKKKRREILNNENAELIFGMEESKVEFMDASKNFINNSKKMNGNDRVKNYEALKRKVYGGYYDVAVKREDKFGNYQTEISLRDDELNKLNPQERNSKIHNLQNKYFGKDVAEQMRKAETESDEQNKKISDYEKKSQEFLIQNSGLNEKQKEEKLKEIRTQILGADEGEAYLRRKQIEELDKSVKK